MLVGIYKDQLYVSDDLEVKRWPRPALSRHSRRYSTVPYARQSPATSGAREEMAAGDITVWKVVVTQ